MRPLQRVRFHRVLAKEMYFKPEVVHCKEGNKHFEVQ
jgi:hypothetical protein